MEIANAWLDENRAGLKIVPKLQLADSALWLFLPLIHFRNSYFITDPGTDYNS